MLLIFKKFEKNLFIEVKLDSGLIYGITVPLAFIFVIAIIAVLYKFNYINLNIIGFKRFENK
jgi:hypothetical protein